MPKEMTIAKFECWAAWCWLLKHNGHRLSAAHLFLEGFLDPQGRPNANSMIGVLLLVPDGEPARVEFTFEPARVVVWVEKADGGMADLVDFPYSVDGPSPLYDFLRTECRMTGPENDVLPALPPGYTAPA
jgi:hypothetical protein